MKRKFSTGVTLIEFLLALLVWGIALANLLPPVWRAVRNSATLAESVRTRTLAEEIQEEIVALPRRDSEGDDTCGFLCPAIPDSARARFMTTADYDGLEESPPQDPLGHDLPGSAHLTRKVDVESSGSTAG